MENSACWSWNLAIRRLDVCLASDAPAAWMPLLSGFEQYLPNQTEHMASSPG
jgi:hypothetical protein